MEKGSYKAVICLENDRWNAHVTEFMSKYQVIVNNDIWEFKLMVLRNFQNGEITWPHFRKFFVVYFKTKANICWI